MAQITPQDLERRIEVWLSSLTEKFEGSLGRSIFAQWRTRSVEAYHRDARDEIGTRRAESDTGPLRSLSGTLIGAVGAGGPNRPGVIERVTGTPLRIQLEKGVNLEDVPYARIHEYGGVAGRGAVIPARPYLKPALNDIKPRVARTMQTSLRRSFRREVLGA